MAGAHILDGMEIVALAMYLCAIAYYLLAFAYLLLDNLSEALYIKKIA
jgi:hypothetical protein